MTEDLAPLSPHPVLTIPILPIFDKLGASGEALSYEVFFERKDIVLKEVERRMALIGHAVAVLRDDGWTVTRFGDRVVAGHRDLLTLDAAQDRLDALALDGRLRAFLELPE